MDGPLLDALHSKGFTVAVETNGTLPVAAGTDWVTVSPKTGAKLRQTSGEELKLVHPQLGMDPARFEDCDFKHFFLQPLDGPRHKEAVDECIGYCLAHPKWRLSLQMHKIAGIK
jgi:organic radical activating enzyme